MPFPKGWKPDRMLKPRTQGIEPIIIKIVLMRAVFFRPQPHKSIQDDIMFSKTAITVEKAAKAIKMKKQLPIILPPGIFINMFGNVTKIRLGH